METKSETTGIRISVKANENLSKLSKAWKAKSKVESLEYMISYFQKMGINPFDIVPETLGARLEKRVNQIIAFIRENEKRQLQAMERVIVIANDKLQGANIQTNDELAHLLISRLSVLGDREAVKMQLISTSRKYAEFITKDLLENENTENKKVEQSPAFKHFIEAINKILE